jgi:pimeloyl-ACP methyl ester carboxylesterase
MKRFRSPAGITVSYDTYGAGPALVLVHGAFSDQHTNWEFVRPLLETRFTVYAIARRGRGSTDATSGHGLEDESDDVVALIREIGQPVFLLGHSYGAQAALAAAPRAAERVRKLVLYEPPWPSSEGARLLPRLEELARNEDWEGFSVTFFRELLLVPEDEFQALHSSDLWPPIVGDARASLGDIRALLEYRFDPERFRELRIPVLLQFGTESPRQLYATDALAAVLPDARVEELAGQAHEAMTTAPELYAESVTRFLLS